MSSRTQMWRREREPTLATPSQERWLISLNESLSDHIRLLTQRRHTAFGQAATYRLEGHLVPGSVTEELTENASQLRGALERYAVATAQLAAAPAPKPASQSGGNDRVTVNALHYRRPVRHAGEMLRESQERRRYRGFRTR